MTNSENVKGVISRRNFLNFTGGLTVIGGLGLSLAGTPMMAGAADLSSKATKARTGGTLRLGVLGGSSSDTLDGNNPIAYPDFARVAQLYDPLVEMNKDASISLVLAEEIVSNADATVWTIKLRPGVTFHDGKPLTAADVIFTIRRIIDPKNPLEGSAGLSQVVPSGLKAVDHLTVQVTLKSPNVVFEQLLAQPWHYIVPTNYNPRRPVGTGAFKFQSFVPGQESVFVKNENYWQTGLPYVGKVIITDFTDSTSQANALLGGQVDLIDQITGAGVDAVKSGSTRLSISPSGAWQPITMRVDVAPFNDVRVRQAMRLLVDRRQMVENVLGGHGSVGNDLFARWDPDYDSSLPQREADVGQAKFLLKKAGHEGLTIPIVTAPIAGDVTGEAQVFAQQAQAAGVKMSVRQTTVDTFFGKSYLSWKLAQDWYTYFPYLNQVSQSMLPISPFNETHWHNAKYNSLYSAALRETHAAKRKDLVHEMQTIEWNQGGYIVPYFVDAIGAHGTKVSGIQPTKTGVPFNNYNLKHMWLA